MIDRFDGTKHRFLSNFWECEIVYDGLVYGSTEAAYQAAKLIGDRTPFTTASPAEAKRMGQTVPLREDWEQVKDDVMFEVVLQKFTAHPDLAEKLLATGDEELVEGNTWGDKYWGQVNGVGKNMLGKTLMRVREMLRELVALGQQPLVEEVEIPFEEMLFDFDDDMLDEIGSFDD